jgi:hypothetical protein
LFSSDFAEFLNPHLLDGTKYVEFYHLDDQEGGVEFSQSAGQQVGTEQRPVGGHVYFDSETGCSFRPFPLPTRARRKDMKIIGDGKYDLSFRFFRNGYLKLRVPRDLLKEGPRLSVHCTTELRVRRHFERFRERKERDSGIAGESD